MPQKLHAHVRAHLLPFVVEVLSGRIHSTLCSRSLVQSSSPSTLRRRTNILGGTLVSRVLSLSLASLAAHTHNNDTSNEVMLIPHRLHGMSCTPNYTTTPVTAYTACHRTRRLDAISHFGCVSLFARGAARGTRTPRGGDV